MNHRSAWSEHPTSGGAMDFSLTPEQQAFRQTVRAWLRDNIPREWKHVGSSEIPRVEAYELLRTWQRSLFDAGFSGLTWHKEYGGRGLTFMEELILQEEMALAKAPPILNVLGVGMAGPTIIAYGTEDQKKRYPPKILSCEEIWCQGYSEPNAGSDLASLGTRAVKDGEFWVINGQKVWTSFAQVADWMMLLARTDPNAPRHKVITKDPLWRQKLARLWIDTECLRVTGARAITKLLRGEMPGAEASTGKMIWVETHQRLQELAMELEGPYAQLWKGADWAVDGGVWQHSFLRSRANSIEGGTTEIQKNIIAERLLGLPKD